MLKDITIGQYYPAESLIHSLDPRTKLLLTVLYIVSVFVIKGISAFVLLGIFTLFLIKLSKIPFKLFFKGLKPVMFIMLFTALLNLFLTYDGKIFWEFYFLKITDKGISLSVFMVLRILFLVMGSSFLMYTTSPVNMTSGLEYYLTPLKKIGVPAHEISMMMSIALRFIPTLIEETDKIMSAQKSRGANLEDGGIIKRAKALIPVLVPLFVSAFRRADELAMAMESRCYNDSDKRTKMKELKFKVADFGAIILCIFVFVCSIVLGFFIKTV